MLQFDGHSYPYAARRNAIYANKGMVATSQPLAAQAGLAILKQGGNAIDAAIATAACLTVVEPTSNGIGGDAFALVWVNNTLHGLNASGPSSRHISIEKVKERGHDSMPVYGMIPVNVPGVPAAWAALSKRFGKLPLSTVLAPAIQYAEEGFPLSPTLAYFWQSGYQKFKQNCTDEVFKPWFETFCPEGRAPRVGEIWRSPAHAKTLRAIAASDAQDFYQGELAHRIASYFKQHNGFLSQDDLATFEPQWVQPISVNYRGYDVWEIPPNGQGISALMALNILQGFDIPVDKNLETYHRQIEAMKLAFADTQHYVTQADMMAVSVEALLAKGYAAQRRALIGEQALMPIVGKPEGAGTVYLCAADEEGNMISFIQSNYMGFGSGIVIPETGIAMANRGNNFSLDPKAANALAPNKRSYNTIIPGFLTQNGQAVGPFGVMGGFMQPQGHVQVIMNTIDHHLNPQAALDAPRWQWLKDKTIEIEPEMGHYIANGLVRKGHDIQLTTPNSSIGRGQIIWRLNSNVLVGGTESRTDGAIAAW